MSEMTHKHAVRRMATHLKLSRGFNVILAELVTAAMETPDILAFKGGGLSMLVEVKVSRADFLADKNKACRRQAERGVGDLRYFAAPKGLLDADEMPANWGLFQIEERCVREVKAAEQQPADKRKEVIMLMSALRRLEISTAVFVRQEPEDSTGGLSSAENVDKKGTNPEKETAS